MEIPKSSWVVEPVYFEARLVKGFKEKYINFLKEDSDEYDFDAASKVIDNWLINSHVWLYQYPDDNFDKIPDDQMSYFEKEDDDWVIPRHLFDPVEVIDTGWSPSVEFWNAATKVCNDIYGRNK